jgi:hypothetical protein
MLAIGGKGVENIFIKQISWSEKKKLHMSFNDPFRMIWQINCTMIMPCIALLAFFAWFISLSSDMSCGSY